MRYFGQNYEHEVEIEPGELDEAALERAFRRFDELHAERYGYAIEGEVIELVSFKVTAIGKRATLDLSRVERGDGVRRARSAPSTSAGRLARRDRRTPLVRSRRARRSPGPAVIEEEGSTLFVEPGHDRRAHGSRAHS